MNEIPIFYNTKLHDSVIKICSIVYFFFCKEAAVGLLLRARKPMKSNTFFITIRFMHLGEHKMKIKTYRTNNKACLK